MAFAVVLGCGDDAGPDQVAGPGGGTPSLTILSGGGQRGVVGTELATAIKVRLTDSDGRPRTSAEVNWTMAPSSGSLIEASSQTDANGEARARWVLGPAAGTAQIDIQALGRQVSITADMLDFDVECAPDAPAVPLNSTTSTICRVIPLGGFDQPVDLAVVATEAGLTAEFEHDELSVPFEGSGVFLTLTTAAGASLGPRTVEVVAAIGGIERSTTLTAMIEAERPVVRVVYIVPADKTLTDVYAAAAGRAARHFQSWLHGAISTGESFTLADPLVQVVQSSQSESWFQTNPSTGGAARFWNNVVSEGFATTGGAFNDPATRWIYFIDADPECGQIGGAGTSGVAVLPAGDLRGLTGEAPQPICAGEPPDTAGSCRWTGGFGHELGHAMDLPHPPGCDAGSAACDSGALMWLGFRSYPDAHVRADEMLTLQSGGFLANQPAPEHQIDCAELMADPLTLVSSRF